jgi:hypothetical protein
MIPERWVKLRPAELQTADRDAMKPFSWAIGIAGERSSSYLQYLYPIFPLYGVFWEEAKRKEGPAFESPMTAVGDSC